MTTAMMARTSQAAVVWEPKKRDRRFSRLGEWLDPDGGEDDQDNSTATAKKSSRKPMKASVADQGDVEVRAGRGRRRPR